MTKKRNDQSLQARLRRNSAPEQQSISTEEGLAAAEFIAQIADSAQVSYALAGGIAMHLYGFTRATTDVDVLGTDVLPLPKTGDLRFGGETYQVEVDKRVISVDWIVRADDQAFLYQEALQQALETETGVPIVTPEWLVLLKHFAARGKDEIDLLWLLRQPDLVDREELLRIVKRLFGRHAFAVIQEMESWFLQADLLRAKDERGDRE